MQRGEHFILKVYNTLVENASHFLPYETLSKSSALLGFCRNLVENASHFLLYETLSKSSALLGFCSLLFIIANFKIYVVGFAFVEF